MKKFVLAAIATFGLVGFVMAEDITVIISSVDAKAGTITFTKAGKKNEGDEAPKAVTATITKDCLIAKGVADGDGAKGGKGGFGFGGAMKAGDKIEKGLADDAFKVKDDAKFKGTFARVTVADEDKGAVKKGQVTQILTIDFGGFGGGKKGGKKGGGD